MPYPTAGKLILEFAEADPPVTTVPADADRGVSIRRESAGFFFGLTSFAGGSGRYVFAPQAYRFGRSYKSL